MTHMSWPLIGFWGTNSANEDFLPPRFAHHQNNILRMEEEKRLSHYCYSFNLTSSAWQVSTVKPSERNSVSKQMLTRSVWAITTTSKLWSLRAGSMLFSTLPSGSSRLGLCPVMLRPSVAPLPTGVGGVSTYAGKSLSSQENRKALHGWSQFRHCSYWSMKSTHLVYTYYNLDLDIPSILKLICFTNHFKMKTCNKKIK